MNIAEYLKRNALSILLLGSFSGCTGAVLYPAFEHARTSAWRSSCQSNLKAITLACFQYQADYDGRFPPLSDGSSLGWVSLLASYRKTEGFSCPAGYKSSFSPSSDYFFNAQLAMKRENRVRDPMFTVAFGDGQDNGPTNSHLVELPNDWNNEDSPVERHYGFANYAFADGHVKMLSVQLFNEWVDTGEDTKQPFTEQQHFKFSPDESASRPKPKKSLLPVNERNKQLRDLVRDAHSFSNSKFK